MENSVTKAKTHVVLFRDKSKLMLSTEAYQFLYKSFLAGKEAVPLNGKIISTKDIKLLGSLEDFYQQYPTERPQIPKTHYAQMGMDTIIRTSPEKMLDGIVKGLKKYLDRENPDEKSSSRQLYKKMLIKKQINEIEKAKKAAYAIAVEKKMCGTG